MNIRKYFRRAANSKNNRRQDEVESRRRQLRKRALGHEALEDRRLLASFSDPFSDRLAEHVSTSTARNGVAIVNLTTGQSTTVNGDDVFGTSSTIKLGVLYNLLRKIDAEPALTMNTTINVGPAYGTSVDRGDLVANSTHTLRELSEFMIDFSDNWAANRLMDFVEGRYNAGTQTWAAPGPFTIANQAFVDLGLNDTRLDRYNTGSSSKSAHGLSGPTADYKAGFDNESTPNDMVSMLRQIHVNNGLLSSGSRELFWQIAGLNNDDSSQIARLYDSSVFVGNGSDWTSIARLASKAGSNDWTGSVGDFTDDPGINDHFQRSEAGRFEFANGETVFYAVFADEATDRFKASESQFCIGYDLAVEYADAQVTHTPAAGSQNCELNGERIVTVRAAGKEVAMASDGSHMAISISGDLIAEIALDEIDDVRFVGVPSHVTYEGSNEDEVITLAGDFADGSAYVVLGGVPIEAKAESITLDGYSGADEFVIDFNSGNPVPPSGLMINGGDGAGDSIRLQDGSFQTITHTFENENDGAIDLDGSTIHYTGLEPIADNLNAVDRVFTFSAATTTITLRDDLVLNNGFSFIDSDAAESVLFVNPTNSLTVNMGGGVNTINVTPLDETFNATLIIKGGIETDIINITTSASNPLSYEVYGGTPASFPHGDILNVNPKSQITFTPGPGQENGSFLDQDLNAIDFFEMEFVTVVTTAAGAVVNGTNDADEITVTAVAENVVGVAVNDRPVMVFSNISQLFVNAQSGDDNITLERGIERFRVAMHIDGGLSPTDSDSLRVLNQLDAPNSPVWNPRASVLSQSGLAFDEIRITGIEKLVYDGGGLTESLSVDGADGIDERFVHRPGDEFDQGFVQVDSLLGIHYENLGTSSRILIGDSFDDSDEVLFEGTSANETFRIVESFGIRQDDRLVVFALAPKLVVDGLGGSDKFEVFPIMVPGSTWYSQIEVVGGDGPANSLEINGQSGRDEAFSLLQAVVDGSGTILDTTRDFELTYHDMSQVTLLANEEDDDDLGVGSLVDKSNWIVDGGYIDVPAPADRIRISDREDIEFTGFRDVELVNGAGSNQFSIYPTHLIGYDGVLTVKGYVEGGLLTAHGLDAPPVGIDNTIELIGTEIRDVVTAAGDTFTFNGKQVRAGVSTVEVRVLTLGGHDTLNLNLGLPGVAKVVDGGAGDDSIDLLGTIDATIFGGDGDDIIIGSPIADLIFGGAGNDVIDGRGGNDTIYGQDGNDTITGGTGDDKLFGGEGSDTFIWNNGDNNDIVEGDEGIDVQIVNGAAAGDAFALSAMQSGRALFERTNLVPFTISTGGVEQFNVNGLAGADTFAVNDLTQTDVKVVNLDLGAAADTDAVSIEGRTTDDTLWVTNGGGSLAIKGLLYDINVLRSSLVDGDTIAINGNEGNDSIDITAGVQNVIVTTINGGLGDDQLSGWFNTANGGDGNDFIRGAANDQTLNGGAGEDTMIGGAGVDMLDGGADYDTILIQGTSGNDTIQAIQTAANTLVFTVQDQLGTILDGGTQTDTFTNTERVRIEAGDGDDVMRVSISDTLFGTANASLLFDIDGGTAHTRDRLAVIDDATDDLSIYRKGVSDSYGSITIGPANVEPFDFAFANVEYTEILDQANLPITLANNNGRVVVFKHDPFEANNDLLVATHLGAGYTINVDPTIDPGSLSAGGPFNFTLPADEDWYRIEALATGTLDFQAFFEQIAAVGGRPGLPGNGDLQLQLFDADGAPAAIVTGAAGGFGTNDADNNERIRIPAVAGQTYYLRVYGATSLAVNNYSITVVNEPAPVPFDLELADQIFTNSVIAAPAPTATTFTTNPANYAAIVPQDPTPVAPADDFFNGKFVSFTSGPQIGQRYLITDYVAATGTFTINGGFRNNPTTPGTDLPTAGDLFLIESIDTGRSQLDNSTRDTTPTIFLRVHDSALLNDIPDNGVAPGAPLDEVISIPFMTDTNVNVPTGAAQRAGFRVAVFLVEENTHTPVGYAQPVDPVNLPGVYRFTFPTALTPDGSYFISARVEMIDPALNEQAQGFGGFADSLEIHIDATAPAVYFGDPAVVGDGLHPGSDSGDPSSPAMLVDRITNHTTPTFFGSAEANAIVRLYVDRTNDGFTADDLLIGQTVASPLDGTNQHPFGQWQITSTINMNDPLLTATVALGGGGLGLDGVRNIYATAEDVSGNVTPNAQSQTLQILVDTTGPQVTDVYPNNQPTFDLFNVKQETPAPTPRVDSLSIRVQDLPARVAGFLYPAIANLPLAANGLPQGLITLVGDHSGAIPFASIVFTPDAAGAGTFATGTITLKFTEPLPDDRFTLTLSDSIIDPAGNKLDGESDGSEPGMPAFREAGISSGDGIPGGDFVARFTVDSRPEVGTWSQGLIYVDINGNHVFDPEGQDNDATNRDFVYQFGRISDGLFAGNFASRGADATGFDKIGAYGLFNGSYSFLLDTDDDGVGDVAQATGVAQVNGAAVGGNFNGNAADGDEVAVFDGSKWYVYDIVGTGMVLIDTITTSYNGIPFAGDFNGDGNDDFAVYVNNTNTVIFDTNRDGISDGELMLGDSTGRFSGLSGFTDKPVAGDLNLDGVDDIGIWVKGRQAVLPKEQGEFFFWVSDVEREPATGDFLPNANPLVNFTADAKFPAGAVAMGTTTFSPAPLGNDLFVHWGDEFALPIFGNFDPPVGDDIDYDFGSSTNEVNPYDVNSDGSVTSLDALILINKLNAGVTEAEAGSRLRLRATVGDLFIDVNGDKKLTAVDALQVINELNRIDAGGEPWNATSQPGGEPVVWQNAVDSIFASEDEDEEATEAALGAWLGLTF